MTSVLDGHTVGQWQWQRATPSYKNGKRRQEGHQRQDEAMSTSSLVWLFASFTSLLGFSWPLIGYIHIWERTVKIGLETSTRNPPLSRHSGYSWAMELKNILTAQVCERPAAAHCKGPACSPPHSDSLFSPSVYALTAVTNGMIQDCRYNREYLQFSLGVYLQADLVSGIQWA